MPDGDSASGPAGGPVTRRSRGVRAFFRRWRRGESPVDQSEPIPVAADALVDIVDQAEAFKTLRVEDVMTPRADIVAVEIDRKSVV